MFPVGIVLRCSDGIQAVRVRARRAAAGWEFTNIKYFGLLRAWKGMRVEKKMGLEVEVVEL